MVKGLLLLSSGIDSPVAGYLMQQKGIEVIGLHYNNQVDTRSLDKLNKLAKKLNIKVIILPYKKLQQEFAEKCERKYQCVLCKRFMVRIAEKVAKENNCDFLITGDNLGQVASQTLENMFLIDSTVDIKILRPLLCNDKQETIEIAKKIGTYDISIEKGICCNFVPPNPVTKARKEFIEREEKKLKIKELVKSVHA